MPLTGGYRRTPVLQIGADIYCDTRLILRELDRRWPCPTLYPSEGKAVADAITYWAETQFFRPLSLFVSGNNLDVLPPDLQADRARMRDLPIPDEATLRRAALRSAPAVRIQLAEIESMLSSNHLWLVGPSLTVADLAVYQLLWFITARTERLAHELAPYPQIRMWMNRLREFGHGTSTLLEAKEALKVAAEASPEISRTSYPFAEDPTLGTMVRIRADDWGRDPVMGELVFLDAQEIAISREDPQVGEVVVHFPRLGFDIRPLDH